MAHAARIHSLDVARGIAICLMILSHGVKGLLGFDRIPEWGLVPVHLITKFSSSLFIIVFGASLGLFYGHHTGTPEWPARRAQLLKRSLIVLFWYKVLTIVEMFQLYSRQEILDAILYRAFPVYSEILGFYAIALLWVPLILPLWNRLPLFVKLIVPVTLSGAAYWLSTQPALFGSTVLKAILVEDPRHYTWGQLTRGPLIFSGLLIAEGWKSCLTRAHQLSFSSAIAVTGILLLASFYVLSPDLRMSFHAIALNDGKHPPGTEFMLFSIGGALTILAACLSLPASAKPWLALRPFALLGKNSLNAFVFHLLILFICYRFLLDLWKKVPYPSALELTLALTLATALWIKLTNWVHAQPGNIRSAA